MVVFSIFAQDKKKVLKHKTLRERKRERKRKKEKKEKSIRKNVRGENIKKSSQVGLRPKWPSWVLIKAAKLGSDHNG